MNRPHTLRPSTYHLLNAAFAALLAAFPNGTLHAQIAALSPEERETVAVVERFFQGMLERDADLIRSTVVPNALLWGAVTRDGSTTVRATPIDQFITSITQRQGDALDERIFAPDVNIDGSLAHVWTFYTLHVGDRFSHCGYDSFQLVRADDGWKIVSIADTRRTDDCDPPGGG